MSNYENISDSIKTYCKMHHWNVESIIPTPSGEGNWDVQLYLTSGCTIPITQIEEDVSEYLYGYGYNANIIGITHDSIINEKNYIFSKVSQMFILSIYFEINNQLTDFSVPYSFEQLKDIINLINESRLDWYNLIHQSYQKVAVERIPHEILKDAQRELAKILTKNVSRLNLIVNTIK